MSATKDRRDSVSEVDFLAKWRAGVKAGLDLKAIADSFGDGRKPETCSVRASVIRNRKSVEVEKVIAAYEAKKGVKITPEKRDAMFKEFVEDVVPFVTGGKRGRKRADNTAAMDSFLDQLNTLDNHEPDTVS